MDLPRVTDCPECRGAKTVVLSVCAVCFAEFDEWHTPHPWSDVDDRDIDVPVTSL